MTMALREAFKGVRRSGTSKVEPRCQTRRV
jgi:hypothetical protein